MNNTYEYCLPVWREGTWRLNDGTYYFVPLDEVSSTFIPLRLDYEFDVHVLGKFEQGDGAANDDTVDANELFGILESKEE